MPSRKRIQRPTRFLSDNSDDDSDILSGKHKFPKPPKIARIDENTESLRLSEKRTQKTATTDTLHSSNLDFQTSCDNTPTTSTAIESNSQVMKKLLSIVIHIREQNNEILSLLNKNQVTSTTSTLFRLEDLPVNLAISTQADLDVLETYLKNNQNLSIMCSYLATLGGRDLSSKTNKICKYLLTDNVASMYSFYGKRMNKRPFFPLKCCSVILQAVKSTSCCTEKEIEDVIKVWLKHAPQRMKLRNMKNSVPEHN